MMKCRKIQKKLSAHQDKELNLKEQEQVKSHLLSCRVCREQFAELERVWQTLKGAEEIHPDPWFYSQLVRKMREPRERGFFPGRQWVSQMFRTPVLASIVLAIGILGGAYLGNILARSDFFPFQPERSTHSQEALFGSLKVFDPAPPGTLAQVYLQMVDYKESASR